LGALVYDFVLALHIGIAALLRIAVRVICSLPGFTCAVSIAWLASAFGEEQPTSSRSIWEAPVLPQSFDKLPFQPVRIPEWVQNTVGVGYTLSGQNSEARARAAAAGVTISELGFVDPFYAYYDSKLLSRRSPHVPEDRIDRDIAEYRRLGIRVLAVYPPTLQSEVYEAHPDWRHVGTDTTEIPSVDLTKQPAGGMLCLLGPYGDFFLEVLAEIATRFPDVAAFSFDGLHYAGVCYCQHCRENFRRETGGEIPKVDMEDLAFRKYQAWADRRIEDVVRRMQTRLKAIRPELALVTWTTNSGRFGHLRDIPRNMPARMNLLFDAPDQEFWLDESNRGATIVPAFANAYAWAVTNHRVAFSEPYLMSHGNPYGKDSFPAHEIERRMMLGLTYGTAPSLAIGQPARLQEDVYRILGEVEKRRPWLTHKSPEPWAAMVMSDNTRCFYGRSSGHVEERYLASVFGFFRAATEKHLPFTLVNDWNITDDELAKYQVLILPNTACLDARQISAIERFVANGGGLVASLDASLCDEFGTVRTNFGLTNVLGVDHLGIPATSDTTITLDINFARNLPPDYWEKRRGAWDFVQTKKSPLDNERINALIGNDPVTFKGQAIKVGPHDQDKVVAAIGPKNAAKGETVPAIVLSESGKGRVAYFAAGLDAAYYLYSYPYQRELLTSAILWAAKSPPPVHVRAPMCVHAVLMHQSRNGERLVLHLFNDANTTAFHAFPNDDVPLREETLPIRDIEVQFTDNRIRRVHLEPGGRTLAPASREDGFTVLVPELEVHAMLVAEFE
jgi:type 1 glutamine amidotransferase